MIIETIDLKALCEFLIEAKKNSYAGDGARSPSKCILSKNYLYTKGEFRYEDQYFGEYLDVGEEIVWFKEIPVWGMGYRGGMIEEYRHLSEETFMVLRKALMMPHEKMPVRGPYKLVDNEFKYINLPNGDITSFTGRELIKKDNVEVYFRNYVGGFIFGKSNKSMKISR